MVALPLVLVILVFVHMVALHHVGSNNPDGIEIKKNKGPDGIPLDGIGFHPYYTVHDIHAIVIFLFFFALVVFFAPEMGGYFLEKPNFVEADALKTPDHIAPVWYYTPYYSMLRASTFPLFGMTAKFWGFVTMAAAIIIPAFLPWLDKSPVKSIRYKGLAVENSAGCADRQFLRAGLPRHAGPNPGAHRHGAGRYHAVLPLLPADALVYAGRKDQARAGQGDDMSVKVKHALALIGLLWCSADRLGLDCNGN